MTDIQNMHTTQVTNGFEILSPAYREVFDTKYNEIFQQFFEINNTKVCKPDNGILWYKTPQMDKFSLHLDKRFSDSVNKCIQTDSDITLLPLHLIDFSTYDSDAQMLIYHRNTQQVFRFDTNNVVNRTSLDQHILDSQLEKLLRKQNIAYVGENPELYAELPKPFQMNILDVKKSHIMPSLDKLITFHRDLTPSTMEKYLSDFLFHTVDYHVDLTVSKTVENVQNIRNYISSLPKSTKDILLRFTAGSSPFLSTVRSPEPPSIEQGFVTDVPQLQKYQEFYNRFLPLRERLLIEPSKQRFGVTGFQVDMPFIQDKYNRISTWITKQQKSRDIFVNMVNEFDQIFEDAPALEEDIVVYRGLNLRADGTLDLTADVYQSTSPHKHVAESYSGSSSEYETGVILVIKVKKGNKIISIPNAYDEIVLPRGGTYEVLDSTIEPGSGKVIMYLDYIAPLNIPKLIKHDPSTIDFVAQYQDLNLL
jgi:hypothetical protein